MQRGWESRGGGLPGGGGGGWGGSAGGRGGAELGPKTGTWKQRDQGKRGGGKQGWQVSQRYPPGPRGGYQSRGNFSPDGPAARAVFGRSINRESRPLPLGEAAAAAAAAGCWSLLLALWLRGGRNVR